VQRSNPAARKHGSARDSPSLRTHRQARANLQPDIRPRPLRCISRPARAEACYGSGPRGRILAWRANARRPHVQKFALSVGRGSRGCPRLGLRQNLSHDEPGPCWPASQPAVRAARRSWQIRRM
jgi:hypothetical protein